jgi:hypothetical protein
MLSFNTSEVIVCESKKGVWSYVSKSAVARPCSSSSTPSFTTRLPSKPSTYTVADQLHMHTHRARGETGLVRHGLSGGA